MTTKIPVELSSTPGIVDNSDATAITITSDEKVGIGTSGPSTNLHIGSGTAGNALGVLLNRGATTNFFEAHDGTKSAYIGTDNSQTFIKVGSLTNHAVQISQNNGAAIFIDTSKNVGIGTTTIPHGGVGAAKLALDGGDQDFTTGPHVQMTTASDDHPLMQILSYAHDNVSINFDSYHDGSTWKSSDAGSNFQIYKLSDNLQFRYAAGVTAGSEPTWAGAMNIDSTGRVRVNNTQGLTKFSVGNGTANALIEMASSSATAVYYEHINRSNTSGGVDVGFYARGTGDFKFYTGSYTVRFTINESGGSNGSDEKLKKDIENISYGLDTVKSLQPRKFKWKETNNEGIGFIAQEVESLIPEVVADTTDAKGETDEVTKVLNYANLTAVLTKAIQEQQAIIEDLQTQINEVKNGN